MLQIYGYRHNPRSAAHLLGSTLACLTLGLLSAAGIAAAQDPDSLPSAPQPQIQPVQPIALAGS